MMLARQIFLDERLSIRLCLDGVIIGIHITAAAIYTEPSPLKKYSSNIRALNIVSTDIADISIAVCG